MRTLGIDLAAGSRRTAACVIEWHPGSAIAHVPSLGCNDDAVLAMIHAADYVGIDSPFGWPDEFVDALVAHRAGASWPAAVRDQLRLRETDRYVRGEIKRNPLSVSADKIGVVAMRCAALLDRLAAEGAPVDRSGAGRVIEVYPAGALCRWGYDADGYKRGKGRAKRRELVRRFAAEAAWLTLSAAVVTALEESDDAFDALISALVARAAALGHTEAPDDRLRERVRREGWIHLPKHGCLAQLLG